jgi:hypothetical protein
MSRRRWPFAKWLSVTGPWWRRIVLGRARRPGGFGGSGPPGAGLSAGRCFPRSTRRSQKTPSNQLIQPGRSNICHQDSLAQMWKARSPLEGHSYELRLLILAASASGGLGRPCVQHQHLLMLTCAGLALLPDRPGPAVSPTVRSTGPYGPVASRARMTVWWPMHSSAAIAGLDFSGLAPMAAVARCPAVVYACASSRTPLTGGRPTNKKLLVVLLPRPVIML